MNEETLRQVDETIINVVYYGSHLRKKVNKKRHNQNKGEYSIQEYNNKNKEYRKHRLLFSFPISFLHCFFCLEGTKYEKGSSLSFPWHMERKEDKIGP